MGEKKNIIMNLVELGKRNQKVTTKEINDALEEIGFEVELVDKLYEALDANNIEIVDEPDADVEEFTLWTCWRVRCPPRESTSTILSRCT